ncbi:retrovirus-related pol polyprotein from transposon TNT 1-94 [Tanacetum coccineum]
MAEDGKIKINKFDGHGFGFWKMQIEDYLYQKNLHEPLAEAKPTGMKAEDWALLDRQAMGTVRLSLAKNVATTLSIRRLYPTCLRLCLICSIVTRLRFTPGSWPCIVTAISGSTKTTKLKFDNIRDLILREDIHRKTSGEYSNSLLSAKDKDMGRKQNRGQKQNRGISKSKKRGQSKNRQDITDKEVNMAARNSDDTLVRLADDKTLDIASIGDVVLKTSSSTSWTLKDVRCGSMYMLEVPSDEINASIDSRGNTALWYQRLAYMSEKGMKILASKVRDTRKLRGSSIVHTNVYGPTTVASIGGSRYYVTFIDDSSRKVWVNFLKNKSEIFNTFKKWKATVENETNLRVKCLKSDNGGEYSSQDFIEYCVENGIRMLKTIPETPQQNGVAARMNRTLNESANVPTFLLVFRIPEVERKGKDSY